MLAGLAQLSSAYGVPSNASTYVELASGEAGSAVAAAVGTLLTAILSSHILTESVAFYSNETVSVLTFVNERLAGRSQEQTLYSVWNAGKQSSIQ